MTDVGALVREAASAGPVAVMEPPAGLTDVQRAAVEQAVQMLWDGRLVEAYELLRDQGFDISINRVQGGKLVPA